MIKVIITIFFITVCVFAQLPEIQFESITAADGLENDDVIFSIYQDREGFIWFLTLTGISRYDGYSFKNYKPNPQDNTSLPGGYVTSVYEDDNGQLWIGSSGLVRFDKSTEQFSTFRHDESDSTSLAYDLVWDIKPDGERGLWLATDDGLDHFDFETKIFTHFKNNPNDSLSLSGNNLKTLYIDRENILWAGAGAIFSYEKGFTGLNRFDPETGTFKHYFYSAYNECTLADNNIFSINEDQNGTLYVGTGKSMLHRYNREKDCFERLTNQSEHEPYAPPGEGFADFKHMVWSFIQDRDSIFWISTFSGGINRFDLKNDVMVHYPTEKNTELRLGSKNITRVYEDRQGIKWIGTSKTGIFKVIPSRQRFHSLAHNKELSEFLANKDVRVLYEDSQNTFWIATSADIIRFDPVSGKMTNYAATMDFPIKFVDAIYEDGNAGIWFGGSGTALNRIDLKSGMVKRYTPENSNIAVWQVININADSDTTLWVSAEWDGLMQLNLKTDKFKFYRHDPDNERSLSSNSIWTTLLDGQKDLWIATKNGLNRLNRGTDDFDRFFPGVEIHAILEDHNHNLWLGTIGSGLIRFNKVSSESTYFNTEHGLQSDEIYALVEDDHGYLWIGTKFGLTRFDPESYRTISFKKEDGLLSQLSVFADGVLKTKDGLLLFGGNGGITAFSPEDFKINTYPPFVAITGLSVYDKPYKEKGRPDSVIALEYNQNDLTIDYVSLHFKNPKKNLYKVKLEPYEKEWSKASSTRQSRYTNLAPGEYTFYVKASNSDGVWNEKGKKLSIIIKPPVWATWWAYSLYVLFGFGLLYSARRFELNRQRKNSEIKESKLRAEAAELQAKAAEAQSKVVQAENERKSKELEEARQLQLSMLPKELPQLPNLEIAVYMKTATEVGGDYYDFIMHEDGSLNVCLGDATGHGMKAGIMVSSMKSIFTTNASKMNMEQFFETANAGIKSMNLMRMMMGLVMVNINTESFKLINAGMPPVFFYSSKSASIQEIKEHGMPVGAMRLSNYKVVDGSLQKGDVLLLVSDGMPELSNGKNEMFGYNRLLQTFSTVADKTPAEIIDHLKNVAAHWADGNDPDDDVTFVVIKVK